MTPVTLINLICIGRVKERNMIIFRYTYYPIHQWKMERSYILYKSLNGRKINPSPRVKLPLECET